MAETFVCGEVAVRLVSIAAGGNDTIYCKVVWKVSKIWMKTIC